MAIKLAFTLIFVFFAFSYAQSELDIPKHDVGSNGDVSELPESDSKITNIFLPSQKKESEVPEIEPETNKPDDTKTESAVVEIEPDTNKPVDAETGSVPLTFVTFRPINRHFRQRPVFPSRRCGGGLRRGMLKPWLMRFDGGEIPYVKDMIVEKDAEHDGVRKLSMPLKMERIQFGSEMEAVPLRRHRHHHRHHPQRFHMEEEEHHRHHDHHEEDEEEEEHHRHHGHHEEDEEEEEHHHHHHDHDHGSLFHKIGKFLHHF